MLDYYTSMQRRLMSAIVDYTKMIYNNLTKDETKLIARMRTGDAKLNVFLAKIKATESVICACGAAPESVRHFSL